MILILIIIYYLFFRFKLKILNFEKLNNKGNLWTIYYFTIIAELPSLWFVGNFFGNFMELTLTEGLLFWLLFFGVVLECIILLIVGIITNIKQKKIIMKKNIKMIKSKYVFLQLILTFIGIWGTLFLYFNLPRIFKSNVVKYAEDLVLNYMQKKYGDEVNFKIYYISKDYTSETFGSDKHTGFIAYLKTNHTSELIEVKIDGIEKSNLFIYEDNFFEIYHNITENEFYNYMKIPKNKKIKNEFKNYFELDINFDYISYYIPRDCGKIPTIEELVDVIEVNNINLNIDIYDEVDDENKLNYLKKIAQFSINYFGNDKDIEINYVWPKKDLKGFIKVDNNFVNIKINDEVIIFSKTEIINFENK